MGFFFSLTVTLTTSTGGELTVAAGTGITLGGTSTSRTFTGTLTDLNAYFNNASNIQYLHPTANLNGNDSDTITVVINDNGNTGSGGGADQTLGVVNVDIAAVNDAPVNTVPGTQTIAEDTTTAIAGISISDVDAGSSNLTTRLQASAGVLNVSLSGSATISAGSNGSGDLTIQGSSTDINATLASLTYLGNSNVNGVAADTLTVTTNDLGNTGSGGALSDVDTVQIDITAVNDTPDVVGPGSAYTISEQTNLNIHGTGFSVSDVDAASGTMTATFTVGEGDITLVAGDSGVTITANNASTVSFTGTLSQIDALLTGTSTGTIVYNNGSDTPVASTTITLTVNDGGNTGADPSLTGDGSSEEDSASQTINITAVNDIPTTTPVTLMAIAEDSGVRTITQAELLANAYDLDLDPLTATGLSINIGLGTLVDNGDGTWGYTSAANDNTAVTFTYTVTDGTYVVAGLATLDITPVDDAPITAPESYEIYIGETISKSADKGVLSNDSDVENDPLTAVLIMGPSVGNLTLNADGSWIYVSPIDFTGTITFQYAANDGTQNSAAETVAIVILPAAPPVQQVEPAVNPTIDIENPADDDDDDDEDEDDEDQEIQEAIDLTIVEEGPASGSEARGAPNQSNELVSSLDAQFELTSIFQHAAESEENRLSRSQLDWMLNLRIGALAELANTEFFTASLRLDNNALLSSEDIRLYLATFQENTEVRDSRLELDAGIASSVFWAASAGVAVWGMSSSYFVSLAASTLPAWSRFDPIFIVNNAMNLRREDEQSLADLVSGGGSGGDGES